MIRDTRLPDDYPDDDAQLTLTRNLGAYQTQADTVAWLHVVPPSLVDEDELPEA